LKETSTIANEPDQAKVQAVSLNQTRNEIWVEEEENKIYKILEIELEANHMQKCEETKFVLK